MLTYTHGEVMGLRQNLEGQVTDAVNQANAVIGGLNRTVKERDETINLLQVQIEMTDRAWDLMRAHLVKHAPNMVSALDSARGQPAKAFKDLNRSPYKGDPANPKRIKLTPLETFEREAQAINKSVAADVKRMDDLMEELKARPPSKPTKEHDLSHLVPAEVLTFIKTGETPAQGMKGIFYELEVHLLLNRYECRPGTDAFEDIFLPGMSMMEKLAYRAGKLPKWITEFEAKHSRNGYFNWRNEPLKPYVAKSA